MPHFRCPLDFTSSSVAPLAGIAAIAARTTALVTTVKRRIANPFLFLVVLLTAQAVPSSR
jgi:hypothetical protein